MIKQRAFTLIELLVTISIIAILIAIALVALKRARANADNVISLSNLRSHGQAFAMYSNDHSGYFPYFTEVGFFSKFISGGGIEKYPTSYFDAFNTWHIVLADDYYTGSVKLESFYPPRFITEDGSMWPLNTPYQYGCAFIASPQYWNDLTRIGPVQYVATRQSDVSFPSKKILLNAAWPLLRNVAEARKDILSAMIQVNLCDGSAIALSAAQRLQGYKKGDGHQFRDDGAIHFTDWPPFLHTVDGVRGRDLR